MNASRSFHVIAAKAALFATDLIENDLAELSCRRTTARLCANCLCGLDN